ncbi:MAG: formate-dependent phosphoribosylglycinamide formyltransferase [Gammaproteobacteria bacterium]|nr:formate-dependent phosphoribosylglycinamide formyltransferase [Gammaproteobacteria bacterium]MCP5199414.1 formate-dependent phosphoribosylglycinamide formyltransferase [Gammaproteobacteria bacterium]
MTTLTIGTPLASNATRLLLLGAGELGREVAIEAMRLGLEVVACDRYANAPAMQVAHRAHVVDMLDAGALREVLAAERPRWIVPEVEAIATELLVELEGEGFHVVPTAAATRLTMDREGIRSLAAETLGLPTSPYRFAASATECSDAIAAIGMPCIVKPVMSSSGKGQITVRDAETAARAWDFAITGGRAARQRVIVEGFVEFDYEITLLTVRHRGGTAFCAPIGHLQVDGDYRESWQPQAMTATALERAQAVARAVTDALGGHGLFGVELFVKGDEVWFSEVSPRPHDTGMVTLISQPLSEFALHVRAILGAELGMIEQLGPAASCAVLGSGHGRTIGYEGVAEALSLGGVDLRVFGKPEVAGKRRLAVTLARGDDVDQARARAREAAAKLHITVA